MKTERKDLKITTTQVRSCSSRIPDKWWRFKICIPYGKSFPHQYPSTLTDRDVRPADKPE
ncbi:hypothetical protein J6590_088203 [Homalodisca vitripennis]|nr:hypothetical protein J6590_088203 [Homalodisca vitripennis]